MLNHLFLHHHKGVTLTVIASLFFTLLTACSSSKNLSNSAKEDGYSPLYIVGGTLLTSQEARETYLQLKPTYFADINLLNPKEATAQCGQAGQYGAVQVTLTDSVKAYSDLLGEYNPDEWSDTKSNLKVKADGTKDPRLIGGIRRLQQKARYPEKCQESGTQGRVFMRLTVNEKGQVKNPKVINGIHWACNQEALRVIKIADFLPALAYGKPIKVTFFLNIAFRH